MMAATSMFSGAGVATPRAAAPLMSTLFNKRTFFIGAPFVGNAGFDPLNIAKSEETMVAMRHAEVKHGRLAMIAALAWPVQELIHPVLVQSFGCRDLLESTHGCSPSIVVGGLDLPEVVPALLLAVVLGAAFEVPEVARRMRAGLGFNEYATDSVAGDNGFDPLGISTDLGVTDRYELQAMIRCPSPPPPSASHDRLRTRTPPTHLRACSPSTGGGDVQRPPCPARNPGVCDDRGGRHTGCRLPAYGSLRVSWMPAHGRRGRAWEGVAACTVRGRHMHANTAPGSPPR